jgi:thioredoxin 1
MASVLREVAKETKGKAVIGIVMTTDRKLVQAFGIRGVPTTYVVRNGEIVESFVGVTPKRRIMKLLDQHGS